MSRMGSHDRFGHLIQVITKKQGRESNRQFDS
jgi:hypothetical protein